MFGGYGKVFKVRLEETFRGDITASRLNRGRFGIY